MAFENNFTDVQRKPVWGLYFIWDDVPFPPHSICFGNPLTLSEFYGERDTNKTFFFPLSPEQALFFLTLVTLTYVGATFIKVKFLQENLTTK